MRELSHFDCNPDLGWDSNPHPRSRRMLYRTVRVLFKMHRICLRMLWSLLFRMQVRVLETRRQSRSGMDWESDWDWDCLFVFVYLYLFVFIKPPLDPHHGPDHFRAGWIDFRAGQCDSRAGIGERVIGFTSGQVSRTSGQAYLTSGQVILLFLGHSRDQ